MEPLQVVAQVRGVRDAYAPTEADAARACEELPQQYRRELGQRQPPPVEPAMKRDDNRVNACPSSSPEKAARGLRQLGRHLVPMPISALELLDGAPVLVGDVGHRELDVPERGGVVGVTHHAL